MSEKKSMIDRVHQSLKEAILYRKIAPGTQLVEKTIAEQLSVSRTPIRHAMIRLEQEGLVTIVPNRGAFVVQPTVEEIRQAFVMRKELESTAARLAIDEITDEDLEVMRELVSSEKETYESADILRYIHVNKSFHMYLAQKTGNTFLQDYMERILDQMNVYLVLYDVFYDADSSMEGSTRFVEHEHIIEALSNRNLDQLMHLIERHMQVSLESMNLDKTTYRSLENVLKD
ncbi:GntR family transcriptional regulator [Pontibacillus chungwhensis BH030062]|uniref:GntR family transcriptional regulator n=1 Tax=Pontibacillus chungwhensis BH030062 TaxID=1385513 RepID=A0A0A2UWV0_9BACI|nr:GntR family transcriptional regulator [Pontibacillus chungwhensis]KGP91001.1 GntR family transcriptional regulator [Pontibacillus chungwhensis BH030062]